MVSDSELTLCKPLLYNSQPKSTPPPPPNAFNNVNDDSFPRFQRPHFSNTNSVTVVAKNLNVIVCTDQWLRLYRLDMAIMVPALSVHFFYFESTMFAMTHSTSYHVPHCHRPSSCWLRLYRLVGRGGSVVRACD